MEAIFHLGKLVSLEERFLQGLIEFEDFQVAENKILSASIKLFDSIQDLSLEKKKK